jgi:hypothetical protein
VGAKSDRSDECALDDEEMSDDFVCLGLFVVLHAASSLPPLARRIRASISRRSGQAPPMRPAKM